VLVLAAVGWLAACAAGASGSSTTGSGQESPPDLVGEGGTPCGDLRCRQVDCASRSRPRTTLSGIVYDPAGSVPLYNVFVYVPNGKPEPIPAGHPRCAACQADATGDPIVSASTDAQGWFHLTDVPAGDDVPLVMQVGKWRRLIHVPHVEACTDNALLDPDLVRLPSKASEGDMPLIALATGCDVTECFLAGIGIDPSEFTAPEGGGHVHVYAGHSSAMAVPGMGDAYRLWGSADTMSQYDVIFAACECQPYPRDIDGPAYTNMLQYLDGGGRLYTTHFHYNWFSPPSGPAEFQHLAVWAEGVEAPVMMDYFVDTSFPRGRAFADWLEANALSPAYGQVQLTDTRDSVEQVTGATRWIYGADSAGSSTYQSKYMTFNTPVATPVANQCGRATFSDVHLSGETDLPGAFPQECAARQDPHGVNEQSLEFLFFDLVSCVQDDSQGPSQPPVH
jgi:hypothetical protein